MNNLFTDVEAAVEEGHYIQHTLGRTAYLVCDSAQKLYVLTDKEFHAHKQKNKLKVIEIFHRRGRYEYGRLLPKTA